jgi:hypothetical protein
MLEVNFKTCVDKKLQLIVNKKIVTPFNDNLIRFVMMIFLN